MITKMFDEIQELNIRKQVNHNEKQGLDQKSGNPAVKTMAQTAVAMLPAVATISWVDWLTMIGTPALAAVVSVRISLAGLPQLNTGTK